ncbi:sensory protein [Sphingobium jiangsuense]|uniref:Tryptophan-rich sensory protein n=1 Tax=Sphingobium jiangsuense TaxID=870476 RepID=A0A7W6FNU8_9SPHN|nr:TspO/MBR family protein [Sphingobium jiangsuense]MBB3925095.1 tryptophan-rich sensory protein [Sphingobium jiangsuense]GLS99158.1 sensory protein [Sphingobium jiangsuense]
MNEIASQAQLRMSYVRWALFTVPAIVFLGMLSGRIADSGYGNRWFASLAKPDFMPPGWAFGVAWTLLYILMGLALAVILHARGARLRGAAIGTFLVQLAANYAWSPLFFRAHMVTEAFWLLLFILALSIVTTALFARIRTIAAVLMLPYLAWLVFAGVLNHSIDRLNPDASSFVVPALKTRI